MENFLIERESSNSLLRIGPHADVVSASQSSLEELRKEASSSNILCVFMAQALTRDLELIAGSGLQKDIRKRISEGYLSYNKAWSRGERETDRVVNKAKVSEQGPTALWGQLNAVFGKHNVIEYGVVDVACDEYHAVVFVEARRREGDFALFSKQESLLEHWAEAIYMSTLRDAHQKSVSDWEKAVHELASPLDFIYSNSDFLQFYLTSANVTSEQRYKKLEDFKLISRLLINRLHQFRYAFSGARVEKPNWSRISIFDVSMPITHLWFHEAHRKNLKFSYDGLRNKPEVQTDEELLQFILFNLISNAIKYSYRDTDIELSASIYERGTMIVRVGNVGPVITEDEEYRIFDYGFRAEAAKRLDARGMGIGLSVARQLTSTISGRLALESSTVEKTIFSLSIPVNRPRT